MTDEHICFQLAERVRVVHLPDGRARVEVAKGNEKWGSPNTGADDPAVEFDNVATAIAWATGYETGFGDGQKVGFARAEQVAQRSIETYFKLSADDRRALREATAEDQDALFHDFKRRGLLDDSDAS